MLYHVGGLWFESLQLKGLWICVFGEVNVQMTGLCGTHVLINGHPGGLLVSCQCVTYRERPKNSRCLVNTLIGSNCGKVSDKIDEHSLLACSWVSRCWRSDAEMEVNAPNITNCRWFVHVASMSTCCICCLYVVQARNCG